MDIDNIIRKLNKISTIIDDMEAVNLVNDIEEAMLMIESLRNQLSTNTIDGWKLVPIEPTEDMLEAGGISLITGSQDRPEISWAEESRIAYKAMINAAPTHKER